MHQQLHRLIWALFGILFAFIPGTIWAQCVSLTTLGSSYTQDFNTLSNTAGSTTNNLTITGWFLTESGGGARDNEQYAVDTGGSTTGDTYSYGATGNSERALGGLRSGTLIPVFGSCYTNNTGSTITSLQINYTGEQWRLGTAGRTDQLNFEYSLNATDLTTGTWTNASALNFVTPNTATTGAKNGNSSDSRTSLSSTITGLSISNGATFWIRFTDTDASGADDGLAIDDFSVTPQGSSAVPNLTINDVSLNEGNAGTTTFTFTVSLSAPAGPGGVTFDMATADGTAVASGDYTAKSVTGQTIPAGSSTYTFSVLVNGDTSPETNETFFVNVTNVTGANVTDGQGQGTIVNDDAAPNLTLNDVSLNEGNAGTTTFTFTVSLSAPAPVGGVTFDIATADGTAGAPGDYTAKSLTSQTIPSGSSTYTFDVVVNGDVTAELNETFVVNVTNATNAIVTDGQGQGTLLNDDASLIHDVQGNGSTSPVVGSTMTVEGIVTRVFGGATALNGFYVQEEDADADADPNTSEGIFVYDPSGLFTGSQGDKIRVTGTVAEYVTTSGGVTSSLTQLQTITSVQNLGASTLPTVASITFPVGSVADLEKYEGMLVTASAASGSLVVTDNFDLGRYGQLTLSSTGVGDEAGTDARLDQYTQFNAPSTAGYTAHQAAIAKRSIILDDASSVAYPAQIIFGRGGNPLSATNTLRGGDAVAGITAVVDHRFEGYRLQTATGVDFQPANTRPGTPQSVGEATLKVAGFNVLNYFNGDGAGGGFPTSRGATDADEFSRQRAKTIQAIINSGADILGLNEMENDGYGSASALQDLVNGLNTATAPGTYTFVNPGTISTDQITVAMLYKPASVSLAGNPAAIPTSFGNGAFDVVGRKPLAQTFRQKANGAVFTVVANHWKSKGSSSGGAGDSDANDGQGQSAGTRTRQAQDLIAWLATRPTGTTDPDYLLVGDFNSYAKEDPLTALHAGGYINLVPNTSYSYAFDGQFGSLDHALSTTSLQGQVTGVQKWHINADEPTMLDYNISITNSVSKTSDQVTNLYNADPFRSSDHDPVVVGLNLTPSLSATLLASSSVCTGSPAGFSLTIGGLSDGETYSYTLSNGTNSTSATGVSTFAVQTSIVPTLPGAFTLTVVTSANASTTAASGNVAINALPSNASLTSGTLTCSVTSVTLTASATGGTSYTLSDGQSNQTGQFDVSTAGNYTVTISNASGCTATATATVESKTATPIATLSASGTLTCSQTSITLTAGGGTSYTFSAGATQLGSSNQAVVSAGGTYTVTVSNANGCTAVATTTVESNTTAPAATLVASSSVVCEPASITLTGGGGIWYAFSGPALSQTGASNKAVVSQSGTYSVVVTNASGCTASAGVSVTVNSRPSAPTLTAVSRTVNTSSTPLSLTQFVAASGSNALSFSGVSGQLNPPQATISQAGVQSFSVTQTDGKGCVSLPTPFTIAAVASQPVDRTVCVGTTAVVSVSVVGSNLRYQWFRNSQAASAQLAETPSVRGTTTASLTLVNAQSSANYYVRVTGSGGSTWIGPIRLAVTTNCGGRLSAGEPLSPLTLSVAPNPIIDGTLRVTVNGAAGQPLTLQLLDLRGHAIRNEQWPQADTEQHVQWDMTQQSSGIYLLQAQTANHIQTIKLIKP